MKKLIQSVVVSLSLLGASGVLFAHEAVSDAWVRATVANQKATGMFATITSTHDGMRLVSANSDIAGVTQIHEMAMDNGVMRMRELPKGLAIEKDKALELKPGGYHVMLLDLKRAPKVGETVNVTLTFEDGKGQRKDVAVAAEVRALNAKPMGDMKDNGQDGHGKHGHDMKH
jgi:copper(I)-binding protein